MADTSRIIHAPINSGRYTVTAPIIKEGFELRHEVFLHDTPVIEPEEVSEEN